MKRPPSAYGGHRTFALGVRPAELRAIVVASALLFVASGCARPLPPRVERPIPSSKNSSSSSSSSAVSSSTPIGTQADCTPSFPDRGGWLGGDAASSVVLPGSDGRSSLWLFGDSFVAHEEDPAERTYPFIHNSIAVSRCEVDGRWQIEYAWQARGTAEPRAFFEPDPDAEWVRRARRAGGGDAYYWPIGAASDGESIYVALLRVITAEANGPFHLPFRLVGVDLARLSRLERSPAAWRIRRFALSDRTDAFPASSLVVDGDALYAFAFLDRREGGRPRILTRIALDRIAGEPASLEDAIETWTEDGRWLPGLSPERARILMDDSASEMSVHFDPGLGEWLAVYAALPTDALRLRRAQALTGPWSAPIPLLRIPELAGRPDALPGELFCYAGKAHPELARSGELLVTWVCNVHAESAQEIPEVLERLRKTPSIYRPEAVRILVPPGAAPLP